jgi:hypothetical protein
VLYSVIGYSEDIEADGVLDELLKQCREELGDPVGRDIEHDNRH